ncbi:putative bifunctional diguanylate cyclase/phosphodiesterase [Actinospica robiniae]|uniref:putative bifunctional diguanylate cyclase/phosphodiesterase n=1 Tax=Actinospica robiniae TaxID=304901 RepID=UPI0004034828|nr:GGDEF domain-containing phosphodiesterase [Actinospica robiniae]
MARTGGGEALDVERIATPATDDGPDPDPDRARDAVRPVMEYATIWFAAAMALVVIIYYAKPQWQLPVWATLGLCCSAATLVGTRLNHPDKRLPWYLLALAMFTLINGDTIYNVLTDVFHQNEPFPSVADASYLFTYPLAAGGIIMMVRLRNPDRDVTALVDALLLAAGLTLIIWVFIITPTVNQRSVPWFNSAVSVGYPIGDVLLLVVILRLLTGGGVRGPSAILLVVGSLGLMTSDIAYLTVRLYGTWHVGSPADLGWVVFYISWACAALHPSMIDLTRPNLRGGPLATGRVFPLAVTALIAPALLLFEALKRSLHDAPVIAVFSAVMFILVIIRLSLQGRQLRQQESLAQSRAMLRELRNRAYHDALTGLANRAKFQERAERAFGRVRESGGEVCMLLIDLDNFKEVNDTLGHRAGDELLKAAAGRLKAAVRPGDLAARFGGDEFAVLLADGSPPDGAEALAARLIRTFSAPFLIWDAQSDVRASIGVATSADATPLVEDEGEDAADILLRNADLALYEAKADGKAIWRRYQPQLYEAAMERMRLRTSLDLAIEREEVFLAYQPIVRLSGPLRVAGFEALVRWQHPELGLLPPDQFIPLAEETGQIIQLGAWVLGRAIADAAAWNAGRAQDQTRHVTVNVSAHQFLEDGMVDEIHRKLLSEGLPAKLLILEITETAFLHHHGPEVSRNLNALSALGVRIAVDDFGTGYSSIAYLRDLSIHILKADKSFVDRIGEDQGHLALLQGIVTVASALGIDVVAEGVETEQQQQLLREMGCSFGQGYLYSSAVPIDRVAAITAQVEGRER